MLPPEVLESIFSYVKDDQPALHASTLVARTWYRSATPFLYAKPIISGRNFDPFVRAICPSVNAHVRTNGLAELVRRLDMSRLVHNGSRSLTARLLGRVKGNLEEFVAPQASFAINCLAALSKCTRLRFLDLSLLSESPTLSDLLQSIASLPKLEILYLPRSSGHETGRSWTSLPSWPRKLRELHVSGGISDESIMTTAVLPQSVSSVSIGHCPRLSMVSICPLLQMSGTQLQHLEIVAPLPMLGVYTGVLDDIMDWTPNLRHLKISADFISEEMFAPCDDAQLHYKSPKSLYLHCWDPTESDELRAAHVSNGIFFGKFTSVRILGIHERLGWRDNQDSIDALMELDTLLKTLAEEEGPGAEISVDDGGIRFFGTR